MARNPYTGQAIRALANIDAAALAELSQSISQTELDYLDGVTAGTAIASKAVVLDASAQIDTLDIIAPLINGVALGATAAELNMAADNSANCEVVAAANIITAAESGKTFFLNSATDFASTLPAPALGLRFKFIVTTAATTTAHTIITDGGDDVIFGAVATADGLASLLASAEDTISLTKTATGGIVGDMVEVISDGTNWYVSGLISVAAGITFTAVI
jgi:hypothetical protein